MKKYSLFIGLFLLSFCSFICNDSNNENSTETNNQPDSIPVVTTIDSPSVEPSQLG